MLWIFWVLFVPARKSASHLGTDYHRAYTSSAIVLCTLWTVYPVVWGVADGGNVITPTSEMVACESLETFWRVLGALGRFFGRPERRRTRSSPSRAQTLTLLLRPSSPSMQTVSSTSSPSPSSRSGTSSSSRASTTLASAWCVPLDPFSPSAPCCSRADSNSLLRTQSSSKVSDGAHQGLLKPDQGPSGYNAGSAAATPRPSTAVVGDGNGFHRTGAANTDNAV